MEENNETTTPDAPPDPPVAETTPPAVPIEVAPPVEAPAAGETELPKPSAAERLGGPLSRLRTLQGPPVVAMAVATFVLFVVGVLLALMVFAPAIAPVRLGTTKAGYLAQRDVEIEKVAVRFAKNFLTFDYHTLNADFDRLAKDTTGNFKSQLVRVRQNKELIDKLKAHSATSRGSVGAVSVQSVHGDTATVNAFLTQTVTNSSDCKQPCASVKAVHLTLVRTSAGWKVDNVG